MFSYRPAVEGKQRPGPPLVADRQVLSLSQFHSPLARPLPSSVIRGWLIRGRWGVNSRVVFKLMSLSSLWRSVSVIALNNWLHRPQVLGWYRYTSARRSGSSKAYVRTHAFLPKRRNIDVPRFERLNSSHSCVVDREDLTECRWPV